jgi:hypothetical protein
VTLKLKSNVGYVYTAYFVTKLVNIIGPKFLPKIFLHTATMKFTLAFSNTPGPIKPFYHENDKGEKSIGRWCQSYVMVAGRVGLCVSCMSYYQSFKVCITADEEVCKETGYLIDLIYYNIQEEIERVLKVEDKKDK